MPKPQYIRVDPNGERFLPHQYRDGYYRVANPALGKTKHHTINQIAVLETEIMQYLKRGFLLRMRGETSGQINLIAAQHITIHE